MEKFIHEGKINYDLKHFPCQPLKANHNFGFGCIGNQFAATIQFALSSHCLDSFLQGFAHRRDQSYMESLNLKKKSLASSPSEVELNVFLKN